MKVLLAIDDSKFSEAAAHAVIQQMRPKQTRVCVLHVVKPLLLIPYSYMGKIKSLQEAQSEVMKEGRELVRRAGQLLRKKDFKVQTAVEEGEPRTSILDFAAQWHPDLIVIGSQGRKGLDRFLIGSVSEFIMHHAPCSVEIVRMPRARSKKSATKQR